MTDAARTLLVACTLSVIAAATFVARMRRHDPDSHERIVAELRAANAAALLLAAIGASALGFTIANAGAATAALETAIAFLFIGAAGAMFFQSPRQALALGAVALLAHALLDLAHRPAWLSTDIFPRMYLISSAVYDGVIAGLCWLARRRT